MEVIIKIADYIFSDSEKTKKGVDRAMGGEVLELKTDKLINEIRQDVKEEVKAEVKEEVKTETKEKIVICMLKRGKSTLEEIAADTQMPIEQVERIKKNNSYKMRKWQRIIEGSLPFDHTGVDTSSCD